VKYAQKYEEQVIPAVEEVLDEEGNVIQEAQEERVEKVLIDEKIIEDFKSLNADQLYASMYGAIQKLMQKVETLEQEVSDLKRS
jgi:transcriptional regulatory protein LevR